MAHKHTAAYRGRTSRRGAWLWLAALMLTFSVSCTDEGSDGPGDSNNTSGLPTADPNDSEAPLSDLDALLEGAPDSDKLPGEPKADGRLPAKFDVVATQSSVKSQGSRGVCSIFSTVALMEHLYIKEGTISDPDFSEQFLQWSVKFEVGAFKNTGGSNASRNLEAINRFGVVDEQTMPYESRPWGTSNDERCTGDDRPTLCYTNGEPSDEIKNSKRWQLPRARWISNRRNSIKAYMVQNQSAVVAGMKFFYQSWNHRGSKLTTNRDYWSEGYILFPNEADIADSGERPAGHSILIVGWDDELEVPVVDGEGNPVLDANGEPEIEKGFFLIKNSWGTGGFGIRNEFGAGYGWLSMRYVERYASVNGTTMPKLDLDPEVCDDGIDNNFDRRIDCDDPQCADASACSANPGVSNVEAVVIPDNDPAGASSTVELDGEGFAESVTVDVDITHPFQGDLIVSLVSPDGKEAVLHNRTGGGTNDIRSTFVAESLIGSAIKGTWTLKISDNASADKGTLNRWTLRVNATDVAPDEVCGDGIDNNGDGAIDCADVACADIEECSSGPGTLTGDSTNSVPIPDNDEAGISDVITLAGAGSITDLTVLVDISHTYIGDLTVALVHPDGAVHVLHDAAGGDGDNISEVYAVDVFDGKAAAGDWTLKVVDAYRDDTGTLNGWSIEAQVQ